jgi:AcrR family transcriptional regulator
MPVKARKKTAPRHLRRDAEENRGRLLGAARQVFAELGFDATMDQIAARAGVGVGTAYRRFANKEELIAALSGERIAEVMEIVDRALAEPDPWQGIVTYLEGWAALHAGDRGLKEMFLGSPGSRVALDEARGQIRRRVDELVSRAKRAGALRPGIEASDLVMAQLMLSAIPVACGEETWRRFLPLFVEGLSADRGEPLPGRAFGDAELDGARGVDHQPDTGTP